jgi:hypothetical protein
VLSYSHCYIIDAQDRIIGDSREWNELFDGNHLEVLLRFQSHPPVQTVTYRRDAVARFGWNEANRQEDYELHLHLASIGPFAFIPRHLGYWRLHSTNSVWQTANRLDEFLGSQARLAQQIGMSIDELRVYQTNLRFRFGQYHLLEGRWWTALRLTLANLRGASSWRALARRLALFAIPMWAVRWFLRWRWENRAHYYNAIVVDGIVWHLQR